jgi:hypothetical protein
LGFFASFVVCFDATLCAASDIVLTIERQASAGGEAKLELTREDLTALPQITVRESNQYVDDVTEFSGPLGRVVVDLIGRGTGDTIVLTAANDYSIEAPLSDFDRFDVVFAMVMDGKEMSLRDKGPIWVIYPISTSSELQDPIYNSRLVWQLSHMEIK